MDVELHPDSEDELQKLPRAEHAAMLNALVMLQAIGASLEYPHTSNVRGTNLRELRPRAGGHHEGLLSSRGKRAPGGGNQARSKGQPTAIQRGCPARTSTAGVRLKGTP